MSKPLQGVVPNGEGQPRFIGANGGGLIVGRNIGPNTRPFVAPNLGGFLIIPVVSDTAVAQSHTSIVHGSGMALIGQEISFLDAVLFRVMTAPAGQIIYETDASQHAAGNRTTSFGAAISRWEDDWIGLAQVVVISDLAFQQVNQAFPIPPPAPLTCRVDGAIIRSMMNDFDVAQLNASMKRKMALFGNRMRTRFFVEGP